MKPDNPPVFPTKTSYIQDSKGKRLIEGSEGMTLRDYFAAKAMQGLIKTGLHIENGLCEAAYNIADAMLTHRTKDI